MTIEIIKAIGMFIVFPIAGFGCVAVFAYSAFKAIGKDKPE